MANLKIWPFRPNWTSSVVERLEWATNVLTSSIGAEQRMMARLSPRRTIEYGLMRANGEKAKIDIAVQMRGGMEWALPIWFSKARTTAQGLTGELELFLAAESKEFLDNGQAAVFLDSGPILIDIDTVQFDRLTLRTPLDRTIPRNSIVYPVLPARLEEQPSGFNRHASIAMSGSVRFIVTDDNDLRGMNAGWGQNWGFNWGRGIETGGTGWNRSWGIGWGGHSVETSNNLYEGHEVITSTPNETETLTYGFSRLINTLDNRSGIPYHYDVGGRGFRLQKHNWFLEGDTNLMEFRKLLYRLGGRSRVAWLPTFSQDFSLAIPALTGATELFVDSNGYAEYEGHTSNRNTIQIDRFSGEKTYHKIIDSNVSGAYDILTIDPPLLSDLTAIQIKRISFISLVRLDGDAVEIDHPVDSEGVSTAVTMFREAPRIRKQNT